MIVEGWEGGMFIVIIILQSSFRVDYSDYKYTYVDVKIFWVR